MHGGAPASLQLASPIERPHARSDVLQNRGMLLLLAPQHCVEAFKGEPLHCEPASHWRCPAPLTSVCFEGAPTVSNAKVQTK
jgi:hypothetical protein